MSERDKTPLHPPPQFVTEVGFNFDAVPGFELVKAYFAHKGGWTFESKACWSSRDKMARVQPDGIGFNLEVWRVDGVPDMLYCQKLEENEASFLKQASDAGL